MHALVGTNTSTYCTKIKETLIDLTTFALVAEKQGASMITTFFFKEGKSASNLRSNYRMRFEPTGTSLAGSTESASACTVTLKESKPVPK